LQHNLHIIKTQSMNQKFQLIIHIHLTIIKKQNLNNQYKNNFKLKQVLNIVHLSIKNFKIYINLLI
jgi:hypothetical protein